ncbi:class I SAM-dependent methyltransferase [Chitinophaga niabensis]|uniref:class I SAM-dependent methyltransferase n=1 Tax=Chitinophaga niabensis TaxID=536979 RepID=UPI0031BA9A76
MATVTRKPFQGITNIIRFNWHFYVIAVVLSLLFIWVNMIAVYLILAGTLSSLFVSWYIYDHSHLYSLNWINNIQPEQMINIHAGFDETSTLLAARYPKAQLTVFDFYDPALHTEVSVKRARKAYLPYPGTQSIRTDNVPLADDTADVIFLLFAAHEIRNQTEREVFFSQLKKALKPGGCIIIAEHLRNPLNFLAYNFGFFHFFSRNTWEQTFAKTGLSIRAESTITPFITTYILAEC